MSKKHTYPFVYPIDDNINIHIEHINDNISCIWFTNNNKEEENIPNELILYNLEDKIVNPFRNTQSYAIYKDGNYKIKYNNKTIINLITLYHPTIPPIIKNKIEIISQNDEDDDEDYYY